MESQGELGVMGVTLSTQSWVEEVNKVEGVKKVIALCTVARFPDTSTRGSFC